jgi:hypothetical protein
MSAEHLRAQTETRTLLHASSPSSKQFVTEIAMADRDGCEVSHDLVAARSSVPLCRCRREGGLEALEEIITHCTT